MTLTIGNQLKAARALAEIDQQAVADAADVNVNTIRNMEACGAGMITSSAVTVHRVQRVLEGLGIEFLNHGQPGVRLKAFDKAADAGSSRSAEVASRAPTKSRRPAAGPGKRR